MAIKELLEFKALSEPAQALYEYYVGYADEHGVINLPMQTPAFVELVQAHFIVQIDNVYIIITNKYIYHYLMSLLSVIHSYDKNNNTTTLSGGFLLSDLLERKEEKEERREPRKRFVAPTLEEVQTYCREHGLAVNANRFVAYYESVGWQVGKKPMKDWKAACRNWSMREREDADKNRKPGYQMHDDSWYDEFLAASLAKAKS